MVVLIIHLVGTGKSKIANSSIYMYEHIITYDWIKYKIAELWHWPGETYWVLVWWLPFTYNSYICQYMFSFILYFRLLFYHGVWVGVTSLLGMGGWAGHFIVGEFIVRGTHGYGISGFLFAIYLHIYLFTLLVHFVMFIFYVCT